MSLALMTKITDQKRTFKGLPREAGRPFGKYGSFEGEFTSPIFGSLKGTYQWKEELDDKGNSTDRIELSFIPQDLSLPQVRDEYGKDRASQFKIYGENKIGFGNSFGDKNLRLTPQEESSFHTVETGLRRS